MTTAPIRHTVDSDAVAEACREPYGFWLDSALVHPLLGRASIFGRRPYLVLRAKGRAVEVEREGAVSRCEDDPFEALRRLLRESPPPRDGGIAGYFGYDLNKQIERLPDTANDDLGVPDLYLAFYEEITRYDCRLTSPRSDGRPGTAGAAPPFQALGSTFTREGYRDAVERALEYIRAGDIYQVNLSQRFHAPLPCEPFDLYLRLREVNPAPFAAFLNFPGLQVLSASPERFLRFDPATRLVQTRPIKGTRPRGASPEQDAALARELINSEKDMAENVMIVDVERNDLGRVAETGSVRVPHLAALEEFATVFHLTTTVEARLRPECDIVDLLLATFPSGSITGAPKIRAMEIIDELEPVARGVYTGAIGWIGGDGSLDLNIVIRTMVVKDGVAYFNAGGGIVADSDPEMEYEETLHKARALAQAVLSEPET